MLQPVNLQLAHFNVEHSAQISRDAIAAAQQTGQSQEVVQETLKRAQMVEAGLAGAEAQKVKRKGEEERDRRDGWSGEQEQASSQGPEEEMYAETLKKEASVSSKKGFDLYA